MTMNIKNFKLNTKVIALGLASLLIYSCGDPKPSDETSDDLPDTDTVKAVALNVGGKLFSVPSPMQTALLIQKSGVAYDKSILNAGNKNGQYASDYSRSLNLGIYGADLGYVSMYNQTQDAIGYLGAVKNLADKIGVSSAFDQTTMKRISDNISNKDSMLVLVGLAYRASDAYLKTNKRTEISSLILTGGWIESMNFSILAYNKKPTDEIKYRIAEQKQALLSIIELVKSHNLPDAAELSKQLDELAVIYQSITAKYNFVEPTTDEAKKTTYINSTTEITITKEQIEQISAKITAIRDAIINTKS
jgi:flagellar basal body rod protein FlgC